MGKGQVTLEFLFAFAATMAVIATLAFAIGAQRAEAADKADQFERVAAAESAVRAIEASLYSGADMSFDFYSEGIYYRIENGRFHVSYREKVIEAGGVFANDDSEPV